MAKPYGRAKPKGRGASPPRAPDADTILRIRLRGKDGAPLTLREVGEGMIEAAQRLQQHEPCRIKWATVSLVAVDEKGREVLLDPSGEWDIHPYKSAADEIGVP
jgi:hypothetical protein